MPSQTPFVSSLYDVSSKVCRAQRSAKVTQDEVWDAASSCKAKLLVIKHFSFLFSDLSGSYIDILTVQVQSKVSAVVAVVFVIKVPRDLSWERVKYQVIHTHRF